MLKLCALSIVLAGQLPPALPPTDGSQTSVVNSDDFAFERPRELMLTDPGDILSGRGWPSVAIRNIGHAEALEPDPPALPVDLPEPPDKLKVPDALDLPELNSDQLPRTKSRTVPLDLNNFGAGDARDSEPDSPFHQPWTDNLRQTLDLAARPIYIGRTGDFRHATFVGLDLHKVFSGPDNDFGTLTFQAYLTRFDNFQPPFADDRHDWEIVYRILNFNLTALSRGGFNVRVGHMEIPYGLEQVINTNGTLRDYLHNRNIGVKGDWGVSVNGVGDGGEYEIALTRGVGNEWRRRSDPFVLAGRVGTPRDEDISYGFSALYAEIYQYSNPFETFRRSRLAFDFITGGEAWTLMGELHFGRDEGLTVFNSLLEFDFHNGDDTKLLFTQLVSYSTDFATGWDTNLIGIIGFRWAPDAHWAVSTQFTQDLRSFDGRETNGVAAIQARYRF